MFLDLFYQTQKGEVFTQTQCIQHEHAIHNFFVSMLQNLGYHGVEELNRQWYRAQKKDFYLLRQHVVVMFADTFSLYGDRGAEPEQWFDKNTIVITDNHALFEPQYTICQLPSSYFGIFSYTPQDQSFKPQRRFGLSVNRFDSQRQLILLELLSQGGGIDTVLKNDYVNFNVWNPGGANDTVEDIQKTFATAWNSIKELVPQYQQNYEQAIAHLPIRNHDLTVEQAHVGAYLTLVIETYADNKVIALSEKTFRALVTPAPWILYAAPGTVNYLKSLGFDVLDDIINHSHDTIVETSFPKNLKNSKYIANCISTYENLSKQSVESLYARCLKAAQHNQTVLKQMQKQWPSDFAAWLPAVISKLQSS